MIIGIDASRATLKSRTGTENYSYNLIKALIKLDSINKYILFTQNKLPFGKLPPNFSEKIIRGRHLWTQLHFSYYLFHSRKKLDLLFIPSHVLPLFHPKKTITTVHGLEFLHYPKSYNKIDLNYLRITTKRNVNNSSKIITVSNQSKKDIIKNYGTKKEKISVIYHGVNHNPQIRKPAHIPTPNPYFITIGRIEPRKNINRIIKSFEIFKHSHKLSHDLLIIGKKGHNADKILSHISLSPYKKNIKYLGYVKESNKNYLLKNATCLIFPSLYEGFGLPILEAMILKTPVITSIHSSLSEIASNYSILVDPKNTENISQAINNITSSNISDMTDRAYKYSLTFSWNKCAKRTLKLFNSLYNETQ